MPENGRAARFQARVVWLFVFACLVTLAQRGGDGRAAASLARRCAMNAAGPS
jgi:hypothetical protein